MLGFTTYRQVLDELSSLEVLLNKGGLGDDELERLRHHAAHVEKIEAARVTGSLAEVDRNETMWALVEAMEFAHIYRGLSNYDPGVLAEKFKLILKGPDHPSIETVASNLARNTTFELNIASDLALSGVDVSLPPDNPDVLCRLEGQVVLIQCKRPFAMHGIGRNIVRAQRQLGEGLGRDVGATSLGVLAISVSRTLNPGDLQFSVANVNEVTPGLTREIRSLVDPFPWTLVRHPRIIGSVFHAITPCVIGDLGNRISLGQALAVYPAPWLSPPQRLVLQQLFPSD